MTKSKNKKPSVFAWAGYNPHSASQKPIIQTTKKTGLIEKLKFWEKPEERIIQKSYVVRGGPTGGKKTDLIEPNPDTPISTLTPQNIRHIENTWVPQPQITVYDHETNKSLTANDISTKRFTNPRWLPTYYQNPMQSYDYLVYESLFKNTIIGPVMTQLVKFIVGTGFEPVLELRNPTNDKKADKALIDKNYKIINKLKLVDRCINDRTTEDGLDTSLQVKMTNLILNMLVFNRSCAVFNYDTDNPLKIDGKVYPDLPVSLSEYHPRDMGLIKISPYTQKMESLQIQQISEFVETKDMIYLWNSEYSSPIHLSKYYGGSMCMPMISPARILQNQLTKVIPTMSDNMAAGLYHTFIEPQGGTEEQKEVEYQSITQATGSGTSSVYMIPPDTVRTDPLDFQPKIAEIMGVYADMIKYICACAKLPQIGFFDESAANRATAVEKIQLTLSTSINPTRSWIANEIGSQWYNKIFKIIYKDNVKLLEKFRVTVNFTDLQVQTLEERAKSLSELYDIGINLDDEKKEEILMIDGLADHLEKIEEPQGDRYTVKNKETGGVSTVKQTK